MKAFSLLFACLCFAQLAMGQQLHVNETRFIIGDSTCGTGINYTIPTKDHGLLMVGTTDCNNVGDIITPINDSALSLNVLICKMDSNMHVSWVKIYGGSKVDEARSVCPTADGGYAILAYSSSNNGDVPTLTGSQDVWLIKVDANGNKLWSAVFGCYGAANAMSITETPEHDLVILAGVNGPGVDVPFLYVYTPFLQDWLLIKTDSIGRKIWSKTIGGTGDEGFTGSVLSANGGYYIVGASTSKDHDCNDTSWHPGVNTGVDIFLIKTDTAGSVLWDSSYGGSLGEDANTAIFDIRDSTIVIAGGTSSSDYMVYDHQGGLGIPDCWVTKIDRNGKLLWETTLIDTTMPSFFNNASKSVTPGPNGGYAVFGQIYMGNIGAEDGRIFIVDSAGKVLANKMVGGTSYEVPTGICPYLNGYALIGNSQSISFSEGININRPPSSGNTFVSYVDYWPEEVPTVNKKEIQPQLLCYPNPAKKQVRVQLTTGNMTGTLLVLNNAGKKLFEQEIKDLYINININDWARGIYVVQYVNSEGIAISAKITIE